MKTGIKLFQYMMAVLITISILFLFYRGEGRIDIFPSHGSSYINVLDTSLGISNRNPTWCKKDGVQCTQLNLLQIPLYYKSSEIKFKVIGDGKINLEFKGIDKRENGKRIPVLVKYKSIQINGEKILAHPISSWHNEPYRYEMPVKDKQIISIKYKCRYIGSSNMKIYLIGLLLFLIICSFIVKNFCTFNLKTSKSSNILDIIRKYFQKINPVYKHSFYIIFIITNIVFSYYIINFFFGNHDWQHMIDGSPWDRSFYEGRYGAFIISQILTGNLYLPIISALWAFAALSLSAIMLAIYWKIPKKVSYFVIFGLILNITPYTSTWFYYAHWTINIFFARLLIFSGFVLADYSKESILKEKILKNIIAILLLNFGLSIYQSFVETLVIVIMGRIFIEMQDWSSIKEGIKKSFQTNICAIIDVAISVIIYKGIFEYMKHKKIISGSFYNMETVSFSEIPEKIIKCIKAVWVQFTDFSMPFYPSIITQLFLILALLCMIQILCNEKRIKKVLSCLSFAGILLLTKFDAFIAKADVMYAARVDFCGYVLFNALIVTLCLRQGGIFFNIKIIIIGIIIYLFALNNFYQQRTYKFGFDAEKLVWTRMQSQIETHPNFEPGKKYFIIQIGRQMSAREKYYPYKNSTYTDGPMIRFPFDNFVRTYLAADFYNIGYKSLMKKGRRPSQFTDPEFMSALKRIYDAGLLKNAGIWPAKNSIIVYEDIILIITDEKDLQKAKQILANYSKEPKEN